jgi:hypothetical protein
MDRKQFLASVVAAVGGTVVAGAAPARGEPAPCAEALDRADKDAAFVGNWLGDLFEAIDTDLDPAVRVKLLEACGRGCYRRHAFKQEIARKGQGDLDRLVAAYAESFEAWRDGEVLHIRYGKVSKGCYCPAAKHRPARPGDLQCECTRATHQAVCEAALGRPCRVEVLESVRRGGVTCHFAVHTT